MLPRNERNRERNLAGLIAVRDSRSLATKCPERARVGRSIRCEVVSGKFVFRARAYAAAHFDWDDMLTSTWPDCTAWLQSEYTGGDDARAYPVTIHGAILGHGESLEEAQPRLANALGSTLPVIALAANAAVADPLAVAAYGADLAEPQPLISYWTPPAARWFPSGKRQINAEATLRLMHAVGRSAEVDLLQRAIERYRRALGYWSLSSAFSLASSSPLRRRR